MIVYCITSMTFFITNIKSPFNLSPQIKLLIQEQCMQRTQKHNYFSLLYNQPFFYISNIFFINIFKKIPFRLFCSRKRACFEPIMETDPNMVYRYVFFLSAFIYCIVFSPWWFAKKISVHIIIWVIKNTKCFSFL